MKSQVLHTVWCNITGEATGEIWTWSLLGVKVLTGAHNTILASEVLPSYFATPLPKQIGTAWKLDSPQNQSVGNRWHNDNREVDRILLSSIIQQNFADKASDRFKQISHRHFDLQHDHLSINNDTSRQSQSPVRPRTGFSKLGGLAASVFSSSSSPLPPRQNFAARPNSHAAKNRKIDGKRLLRSLCFYWVMPWTQITSTLLICAFSLKCIFVLGKSDYFTGYCGTFFILVVVGSLLDLTWSRFCSESSWVWGRAQADAGEDFPICINWNTRRAIAKKTLAAVTLELKKRAKQTKSVCIARTADTWKLNSLWRPQGSRLQNRFSSCSTCIFTCNQVIA